MAKSNPIKVPLSTVSETLKLAFIAWMVETLDTGTVVTIAKRDGSSVDVDMLEVPDNFFGGFGVDGVSEYHRDSSSAALANAFDIFYPNHELKGKMLIKARNEWHTDNTKAVAKESGALMVGARDRLYKGERRIVKASSIDPMEKWLRLAVRKVMNTDAGSAMKKEHDAIDSADQNARKIYLLNIAAKNDWAESDALALKANYDAEQARIKGLKVVVKL